MWIIEYVNIAWLVGIVYIIGYVIAVLVFYKHLVNHDSLGEPLLFHSLMALITAMFWPPIFLAWLVTKIVK